MELRQRKGKIRDLVAYRFNVVPVEIDFEHKTVVISIERLLLEELYSDIDAKAVEIEETLEADLDRSVRVEMVELQG